MISISKLLRFGLWGILVVLSIGMFGFMSFPGWTFVDAVHMVIITIFTVGYDTVHPLTDQQKLFSSLFVVLGCSSHLYFSGIFVYYLTEGKLRDLITNRRMNKEISSFENHIIICGYGRLGRLLVDQLDQPSDNFVIIENNEAAANEARDAGLTVFMGDAAEEKTLIECGIRRARILATVLSHDAANVFISLAARNLNPKIEIIARGFEPGTESILRKAGATHVVMLTKIGAARIADIIHETLTKPPKP